MPVQNLLKLLLIWISPADCPVKFDQGLLVCIITMKIHYGEIKTHSQGHPGLNPLSF